MKNKFRTYTVGVLGTIILTGCVAQNPSNESYNIPKIKRECKIKGDDWKVKIFPDGSGLCINKKERELQEKARIEREQNQLKKLASYEINYLKEFEQIKNDIPKANVKWVQPHNKKQPCKVYVGYGQEDPTQDESFKLYWDGQCKNGYAHGLGREFNMADLTNMWQIAIYRKGQPKNYAVMNDILHEVTLEGEYNYDESNYQVRRYINNKNNDISVSYNIGRFGEKEPDTIIQTSPFWNNSMRYLKAYPNFRYEYADLTKNDEAKLDFGFWIYNKDNVKNGWSIEKPKNQNIIYAEYVNNQGTKIDLPQEYIDKGNKIIDEIKSDYDKALNAQSQAQLIKKQYLRKICKNSVKVKFMDNEDYKEVCNSKYEKDLFAKINTELDRISKEKIAKLEQQRFNQQQKQQEQYRQQQLALERQKVEQQRRQAAAAESANTQRSWDSLNQSLQNMNSNLIRQNTNFQLQQINNYMRYGY